MNFHSRVEEGAKWLDRMVPDWYRQVDVGKLAMGDCSRCVLGYVFGNFWDIVRHPLRDQAGGASPEWCCSHGFDVEADLDELYPDEDHYKMLGDAWVVEIKRRYEECA